MRRGKTLRQRFELLGFDPRDSDEVAKIIQLRELLLEACELLNDVPDWDADENWTDRFDRLMAQVTRLDMEAES